MRGKRLPWGRVLPHTHNRSHERNASQTGGNPVRDKLRSYSAARTEVMPSVEHVQQKYQNNRAENSHQPTRLREKVLRGFKSRATRKDFSLPSGSLPHTSEWGDICTELALTEH